MGCASSAKRKEPMVGKVEGLDDLIKQVGRIGEFPKVMAKELRKSNRDIGRMASRKIKPQIPRSGKDFKVYEGTPGPGRAKKGEGEGPNDHTKRYAAAINRSAQQSRQPHQCICRTTKRWSRKE